MLSRSPGCNLWTSPLLCGPEDDQPMISRSSVARRFSGLAAVMLCAALHAGCSTSQELLAMPTLADVSPTGPQGKKCYDKCSHAEAACKHMCPGSEGLCQDDCVTDTKFCLRDCPELRNHNPEKIRLR